MSGSGSREGFGTPPWDPAEPVSEPEETQTLPGLGASSGQARNTRRSNGSANGGGHRRSGPAPEQEAAGRRRSERPRRPGPESGTAGTRTADTADANGDDDGGDDDTTTDGEAGPVRKRRRRCPALGLARPARAGPADQAGQRCRGRESRGYLPVQTRGRRDPTAAIRSLPVSRNRSSASSRSLTPGRTVVAHQLERIATFAMGDRSHR